MSLTRPPWHSALAFPGQHLHCSTAPAHASFLTRSGHAQFKNKWTTNRPQRPCIPATHMRVLASTTAHTTVIADLIRPRHNQVNQPGCHLAPKRDICARVAGHAWSQHKTNQTRSRWTQPHTSVCWPAQQHSPWSVTRGNRQRALRTTSSPSAPPSQTPASRTNSVAITGVRIQNILHTSSAFFLESRQCSALVRTTGEGVV